MVMAAESILRWPRAFQPPAFSTRRSGAGAAVSSAAALSPTFPVPHFQVLCRAEHPGHAPFPQAAPDHSANLFAAPATLAITLLAPLTGQVHPRLWPVPCANANLDR